MKGEKRKLKGQEATEMEKSHAKAQSRKGKLRRSEIFIANDAKKEASSVGATCINWPLRQAGARFYMPLLTELIAYKLALL